MRKTYDKAFKAKIALEAIHSEKTLQEIADAYSVHPNLAGQWKGLIRDWSAASRPQCQGGGQKQAMGHQLFHSISSVYILLAKC
jgi:transposase-like protein